MRFIKMQGTGNDFLFVEARDSGERDWEALSRAICDRRYGAGADGLPMGRWVAEGTSDGGTSWFSMACWPLSAAWRRRLTGGYESKPCMACWRQKRR